MQLNISSLINKHINQPCLLVGPSPNMVNFNYQQFKGQIITFGDTILRGENIFQANYWIASNNEFPVPNYEPHLKIINSFLDTTFIFSDSALYNNLWTFDENFLIENLKVKWVRFDERHFNSQPCKPKKKCCDLLNHEPERITIQEITKKICGNNLPVMWGCTVAEYAFCLALILGCNPIYIQGVEIPLTQEEYKYFPNKKVDKMKLDTKKFIAKELYFKKSLSLSLIENLIKKIFRKFFLSSQKKSIFKDDFKTIINNFDEYFKAAKESNIKIFNLSRESNLSKCKNIEYLDYNSII